MNKLKTIYNKSIKNKIVIIILSISFVITTLGFVFIAVWNINRIKSDIQTGLTLNAKLVANNCIVPLTFEDNQQATIALSHLNNIDFIETAYLFDKHEQLFAYYPDTLDRQSILPYPKRADNLFENGFFYVEEPVFYKNEVYGTLSIKANSEPLKIAKNNIILTLALLSIILDFLVIILATRMQRYISLPIIKLKEQFDLVAMSHDFSQKIEKQHDDEIGSLYEGFNNLLTQIQIRSEERDLNYNKLQESTSKLNLALSGGEIGIWEWDLNTDITRWDARMEKMFGLNVGEFNQNYQAFKDLLHPDDIAPTENAIKNALEDIATFNTVYRVIWKNNDTRYIKAQALIIKDENNKPTFMIGVCFDITEIKKTEQKVKELNLMLEQKVAERTKELERKYAELEKMNHVFVGRELKMIELKKQIKESKDIEKE